MAKHKHNERVRGIAFDSYTLREIDRLAKLEDRSRSGMVRQAVRFYARAVKDRGEQGIMPGFGLREQERVR